MKLLYLITSYNILYYVENKKNKYIFLKNQSSFSLSISDESQRTFVFVALLIKLDDNCFQRANLEIVKVHFAASGWADRQLS